MKLAVISCWKYRDTWEPFLALLDHFWPNHPEPILVTDEAPLYPRGYKISIHKEKTWCGVVKSFAQVQDEPEPILMFLDDFFLNGPVNMGLVEHGLNEMRSANAGCVRLYPCPGGELDYGDSCFRRVPVGTPYRISTQVALWDPHYLALIASQFDSPWSFELDGTVMSDSIAKPILAFRRDLQQWPLSYICTSITSGSWEPAAKQLCDSLNIEVDWSHRPMKGGVAVGNNTQLSVDGVPIRDMVDVDILTGRK